MSRGCSAHSGIARGVEASAGNRATLGRHRSRMRVNGDCGFVGAVTQDRPGIAHLTRRRRSLRAPKSLDVSFYLRKLTADSIIFLKICGEVSELADERDLGSRGEIRESSSLSFPILSPFSPIRGSCTRTDRSDGPPFLLPALTTGRGRICIQNGGTSIHIVRQQPVYLIRSEEHRAGAIPESATQGGVNSAIANPPPRRRKWAGGPVLRVVKQRSSIETGSQLKGV